MLTGGEEGFSAGAWVGEPEVVRVDGGVGEAIGGALNLALHFWKDSFSP
jgi:hypothetical protein